MTSLSDIEIARQVKLRNINEIGDRIGIPPEALIAYGPYKAKLSFDFLEALKSRSDGKLVLVTAMTPTPAGEGKTKTAIGLTDGLNRIGRNAMAALREPSMGPCFGQKGGATGAGRSQIAPMEDINLHFNGDFHAITAAVNLLAAMIDNHIYWGNALRLDSRRITWRRAVDMNDRALRSIVNGLGGAANGYAREDGFDITVATEAMAILCLAENLKDLERRLGDIIIGQTLDRKFVTARELNAAGPMSVLMRDATQSGADAGRKSGAGARRAVREHRPRLQFGGRHARRAQAGRYGRDRGRVWRRPRRGEILRHQMPAGESQAGLRGDRRLGAFAQDAQWLRQG